MEITLGICGTAGRKEDSKKLSSKHFDAMCIVAEGLLEQINTIGYPISCLISGGAAWADFVSVKLFLDHKVPRLKLFLPSEWQDGKFYDNGSREHNDGGTCNYYHLQFQRATGINSLSQMQIAKHEGAEFVVVNRGFFARNYLVAKHSDFLLAITFGKGAEIKAGGTSHTVGCYLDRVRKEGIFDKSFHFNLTDGTIYEGCQVPPMEDEPGKKKINQTQFQGPRMNFSAP